MMAEARRNIDMNAEVPEEVNGNTFSDLMLTGNPKIKYPIKYNDTNSTTERKTFKCWYCPAIQYDFQYYKKHRTGHLQQFKFQCGDCTYSTSSPQTFAKHSVCHTGESTQAANRKKTSSSPSRASSSMRGMSKINRSDSPIVARTTSPCGSGTSRPYKYACEDPHCPLTFQNYADWEKHKMRHTSTTVTEHRCNLCSYTAASPGLLKTHLSRHASEARNQIASSHRAPVTTLSSSAKVDPTMPIHIPNEDKYICPSPNCPMVCSSMKDATVHLEQHVSQRHAFQCDKCSYSARGIHHLKKHNTLHLENTEILELKSKLLAAKNSSQQDRSESSFQFQPPNYISANRKRRLHGRSRPHKNPCLDVNCPQLFRRPSEALKHHNECHKKSGIFKCDKCTYSTKRSFHMIAHKEIHFNRKSSGGNFQTRQNTNPVKNKLPLASQQRKIKSVVYRPAWFKNARSIMGKPSTLANRRVRRDLLKDGLVSAADLAIIRQGNPQFTYETHITYASGRVVPANFRCFHCPKAFESFNWYAKHQRAHGKNDYGSRKEDSGKIRKCRTCHYLSHDEKEFLQHCKQHVSTTKCWVELNVNDKAVNAALHSSFNGVVNFEDIFMLPGPKLEGAQNLLASFFPEVLDFRLISAIELHDFMKFKVFTFRPDDDCNLCGLQGGHDCGKTSIIIACLIGMAYDLLLDLNQNTTLCGVPLDGILRHGAELGSVEITLELKPYKVLMEKYGSQLKLKRYFFKGLPLSQTEFQVTYGTVRNERIAIDQAVAIMTYLLPAYALRLLVLSPENVDYFMQTPGACNEMFWKIVDHQENLVNVKFQAVRDQIEQFKIDLESRKMRISFLKESLKGDHHEELDMIGTLREMQTKECKLAEEQYSILEEEFQRLIEEEETLSERRLNYLQKLLERLRGPFQDYILKQNYIGDLVISTDPEEFAIWMKEIGKSSETHNQCRTMEEAQRIWRKELRGGHRRLAVTALFLAFWQVLEDCPILLGDAYSSNESEFSLPESSMPLLVDAIREGRHRQFFISVPGDNPEDFVNKYT